MKVLIQIMLFLFAVVIATGAENTDDDKQGWQPFEMPQNTTLKITTDPGAFATLNSEFTWELTWTPEHDILPGTQIELRSLNLRSYFEWQYTRINIDKADITMRRPFEVTSDYVFSLWGKWTIARATLQYGLKKDEELHITITARPPRFSNLDDVISVWGAGYAASQDNEPEFELYPKAMARLHVGAGPVERLGIYMHPMPYDDGKVRVVVAPEDRFSNAGSFSRAIPVQFKWNGKTWTENVKETLIFEVDKPSKTERLKASVKLEDLTESDNITNAVRAGNVLTVTGNPVWSESKTGEMAVFGEFHWHTEISGDGGNPLPEGLEIARDHLNLNFCMPSDHNPTGEQWNYTAAVLEEFNKDEFVTLFGWENSTSEGHDNYYFADPGHPIRPAGEVEVKHQKPYEIRDKLEDLHQDLPGSFIAIPHHTNAVSETRRTDGTPYWYSYRFGEPDNYHRLIEIFQTRGNMERNEYSDAWRGWYANGSSVQDALAAGFKAGFTGGSDCHTGRPVRCHAAKENFGRIPLHSHSLTGVWTNELNRQAVFDGLYNRHTWACWDTRAILYFTVNDALMGSEITVSKGKEMKAFLRVSAEDVFQSIEIISDNQTVWSRAVNETDAELNIDLGKANKSSWYYTRILLRNGGIVYGSPVFVEVK